MTTTVTNNFSLAIHRAGFFSPAIHSQRPSLRTRPSQNAYIAYLTRKLRRFYAKQTQFAGHPNERNILHKHASRKYSPSQTAKKQTQFRTHHLRTTLPTIKMQNKPNFQNA